MRLGADGGFDDAALRAFCEANEVLGLHQHLLQLDNEPALALVLSYRPLRRPGEAAAGVYGVPPAQPAPSVSAAEAEREVPEADRELYAALRRWRNERAEREGKPPFIVFRNAQLVELARLRPGTLAELRRVHGIGDGKARDYGPELLALVASLGRGAPGAADSGPAAAAGVQEEGGEEQRGGDGG